MRVCATARPADSDYIRLFSFAVVLVPGVRVFVVWFGVRLALIQVALDNRETRQQVDGTPALTRPQYR